MASYGGGGSGQSGDDEPRDEQGLPQRGLNILLTYRLRIAALEIVASIENASRDTREFEVGWHCDADFADIQEAQGTDPQQHAPIQMHCGDALRELIAGGSGRALLSTNIRRARHVYGPP